MSISWRSWRRGVRGVLVPPQPQAAPHPEEGRCVVRRVGPGLLHGAFLQALHSTGLISRVGDAYDPKTDVAAAPELVSEETATRALIDAGWLRRSLSHALVPPHTLAHPRVLTSHGGSKLIALSSVAGKL